MYQVEVAQQFKANQGLKSPIREAQGLAPVATGAKFDVMLRIGIRFGEDQLTARGWFVDTDAVEKQLGEVAAHLSRAAWTELFEFRPTFELVAQWAHEKLRPEIPQLAYVELENLTLSVKTRYQL